MKSLGALAVTALLAACANPVDSRTPRAYRCATSADCPGNGTWVCGIDGYCRADVPGAYACEPDGGDAQCSGWHCGLGGHCYDLDAGAAQACDFEREERGARADCPRGYRCGLENVCHELGVSKPLGCVKDTDCEGGWQCTPTGRCSDPAIERSPVPQVSVTASRITQLFDRRPDLIASDGIPDINSGYGSITWSHGPRLTHLFHVSTNIADGGSPLRIAVSGFDLPAPPAELVALGATTYAAVNGRVLELAWLPDGGATAVEHDAGFAAQRLAVFQRIGTGFAIAFNATDAVMLRPGGTPQPLPLPGGSPLYDFEQVGPASSLLAASTGMGVWTAPLTPDAGVDVWTQHPWVPPADLTPRELFVGGSAGTPLLIAADPANAHAQLLSPNSAVGMSCPVCPAGSTLLSVWSSGSQFQTHCRGADRDAVFTVTGCGSPIELFPNADRATVSTQGTTPTMASDHGVVARNYMASGTITVIGVPNLPLVGTGVEADGRLFIGIGGCFTELAGVGMVNLGSVPPIGSQVIASVSRAPTWASMNTGIHDLSGVLNGSSLRRVTVSGGNVFALGVSSAGTHVLVGGTNQLLTGVVAPPGVDAGTAVTLDSRVSPFGVIPMRSLVLTPVAADAGVFAQGYALSSAGLAALVGATARSWTTAPLALPAGDWLELVNDGSHARVAYEDGRLLTLPSRLQISQPLPPPVTAFDFESIDGVDFVATDGGLFVLGPNSDGGSFAVWRPVPLPPATSSDAGLGQDFANGRLFPGTRGGWFLNAWGTVYRLSADAGP